MNALHTQILHVGAGVPLDEARRWLDAPRWSLAKSDLLDIRQAFFVCDDTRRPLGLCLYAPQSMAHPHCIGVSVMETATDARRQGISSLLVKALFAHAAQLHKGVRMTAFTEDGQDYLAHICLREAAIFHRRTKLDYIEDHKVVFTSSLPLSADSLTYGCDASM